MNSFFSFLRSLPVADTVLIAILAAGFVWGHRRGLIRMIGIVLALYAGVALARAMDDVTVNVISYVVPVRTGWGGTVTRFILFSLAFSLVRWVSILTDKLVGWALRLPILSFIQSWTAGLLGVSLVTIAMGAAFTHTPSSVVSWVLWIRGGSVASFTESIWRWIAPWL